jgi:hypothetical protein
MWPALFPVFKITRLERLIDKERENSPMRV